METTNGKFLPGDAVTGKDVTQALSVLGITVSSLKTKPGSPSGVITKGQWLGILAEAFRPALTQLLKTKSQAEYSRVWDAIPASVSHYASVRMAILAGWIAMPRGTYHGAVPLTRAEMAKILSSMVATIQH